MRGQHLNLIPGETKCGVFWISGLAWGTCNICTYGDAWRQKETAENEGAIPRRWCASAVCVEADAQYAPGLWRAQSHGTCFLQGTCFLDVELIESEMQLSGGQGGCFLLALGPHTSGLNSWLGEAGTWHVPFYLSSCHEEACLSSHPKYAFQTASPSGKNSNGGSHDAGAEGLDKCIGPL
jgi:hypothetical protein